MSTYENEKPIYLGANETPDLAFSYTTPLVPLVGAFWFVVAVGIVALAFLNGPSDPWLLAFAALLPAGWAVASWCSQPKSMEGTIDSNGIRFREPELEIPFGSIDGLGGKMTETFIAKAWFPIHIHYDGKSLTIPKNTDVASLTLIDVISRNIPWTSTQLPHPLLADYYRRNRDMFGADRVFMFRGHAGRGKETVSSKPLRNYSSATLIVSILFMLIWVLYFDKSNQAVFYIAAGCGFGFFSLLFYAASFGSARFGIKKWVDSCLVVSPVGLAMVQGDVQGELTWNQLLDVKFNATNQSFQYTSEPNANVGILLKVEGSQILIADVYDRPLGTIHARLVRYWRPEFRPQEFSL